mmetsp:Transcript_55205/g.123408  ORF Transcript_55205/g.123408 Transcript_55205/m.123408 type:complete len:229 (-) Transcript_55205:140-826(-)
MQARPPLRRPHVPPSRASDHRRSRLCRLSPPTRLKRLPTAARLRSLVGHLVGRLRRCVPACVRCELHLRLLARAARRLGRLLVAETHPLCPQPKLLCHPVTDKEDPMQAHAPEKHRETKCGEHKKESCGIALRRDVFKHVGEKRDDDRRHEHEQQQEATNCRSRHHHDERAHSAAHFRRYALVQHPEKPSEHDRRSEVPPHGVEYVPGRRGWRPHQVDADDAETRDEC